MYRFWKLSEKQKCYSTSYEVLSDKKKSSETYDTTSLPSMKIVDTGFFLKHRGLSRTRFLVLRDKKIRSKFWIQPPSYPQKTAIPEIVWRTEGFALSLLGLWDKNCWTETLDTPFLSKEYFDTAFFLKNRMLLIQKLSVLWDRSCSMEGLDTPCLLFKKRFDNWKISGRPKVSSTNF